MRPVAVLILFATALAACSASEPTGTTATSVESSEEELPSLMAAAVEELVTEGQDGSPPFSEYLIRSHVDLGAGSPDGEGGEGRALSDAERAAIEEAVRPFGPVRWIDDPDRWRTDDLLPTIEGAVILSVGEPSTDDGSVLVPVSLWCGGLCATWLTYRLDLVDGAWRVRGTEGPVSIA